MIVSDIAGTTRDSLIQELKLTVKLIFLQILQDLDERKTLLKIWKDTVWKSEL